MFRHRLFAKLTALFVTAFICLNAGGAFCVAYCQEFVAAAEAEHCPLQKKSEHCDKNKTRHSDSNALDASNGEMDCCPLTVSLFAAPVEAKNFFFEAALAIPVQEVLFKPAAFQSQRRFLSDINYRGPPLDLRINRLKHSVFRI